MSKGVLVVLSGFSGSGKGTAVKKLMEQYPDEYALSVSATTRKPRDGEMEGVHYFYKTTEEFEQMIAADELIEYAQYVEHYYGTPRAYVEQQLDAGKNVILEIETQGALQIRQKIPNARLIFLTPPSAKELRRRLITRGTESAEVIEHRMHQAIEESERIPEYEYLVVNDKLEDAVETLHGLIGAIRAEKKEDVKSLLVSENQAFVERISFELKNMIS